MEPVTLLVLVMLATITIGMAATFLAWRERPEPGATSLAAMLAGQTWWSVFFVLELRAPTLAGKMFWSDVQWVGVVVIPVAWFLFALEYTGNDRYVQRRYVALLSIIPALTLLFAATSRYHSILYLDSTLIAQDGGDILSRTGGPWYWVIAGYTYLLGLAGSIPLLGLVRSDALSFRGQSVALLIGTLVPWASNALFLGGMIPIAGIDPTPIAFAISGVAYLGALTQFQLLGSNPSANRRARRLVFERMLDGSVVVDSHDFVVDMNENAAKTLGETPRDSIGRPAQDVIPEYDALPQEGSVSGHLTIHGGNGDRLYDATVTLITDFHGRTIGRVITFHDITEHVRQQQRLEVLNRVLRHNIRTETNLIYGYADLISDEREEPHVETVKQHAMKIAQTAEKARRVMDVFEQGRNPVDSEPLDVIVHGCVDAAEKSFPAVSLVCEPVPGDVSVDTMLEPVLWNVVENAAEHNTNDDPHIWIQVETEGDDVRIRVADDGPGIDEYERSVLEHGAESPLMHGSGLGLWLITWGTGIVGGQVTFEANEPTGSVVTLRVPRLTSPEAES